MELPTVRGHFFVLITPLLVNFISLSNISATEIRSTITRESYGATNVALSEFTYKQRATASVVICGRDCHVDSRCKSFNYHKCSRICQLKNNTREKSLDGLMPIPNSVYFDSSQDTPLLSVEVPDDRYCSCKKLLEAGHNKSGVYTIYPAAYSDGLEVYCDMDTDGGGWIVIQRRQDGSVDFYRNWTEYESGFGNLSGEFWLGNKAIQDLTELGGPWVIRFDMEDWEGNAAWSEYLGFQLLGDKYSMKYKGYHLAHTAGDSFFDNWGSAFETKDSFGIYLNCPLLFRGAWWYSGICGGANLNGPYYRQHDPSFDRAKPFESMSWYSWKYPGYYVTPTLSGCSIKMSEHNGVRGPFSKSVW